MKIIPTALLATLFFASSLWGETFSEGKKTPEEVKAAYTGKIHSLMESLRKMEECLQSSTTIRDVELCGLDPIIMLEDEFKRILSLRVDRPGSMEGDAPSPSPMGQFQEGLIEEFEKAHAPKDELYGSEPFDPPLLTMEESLEPGSDLKIIERDLEDALSPQEAAE